MNPFSCELIATKSIQSKVPQEDVKLASDRSTVEEDRSNVEILVLYEDQFCKVYISVDLNYIFLNLKHTCMYMKRGIQI